MRVLLSLLLLLLAGIARGEDIFPSGCKIWEFTYPTPSGIGGAIVAHAVLVHGPTLSVLETDPKGLDVSMAARIIVDMQKAKSFPAEYSTESVTVSSSPTNTRKARCVVWGTEATVMTKYLSTELRARMTEEVRGQMKEFLEKLQQANADDRNKRVAELLDAIKNNPDVIKALKEATK